MWCHARPLNGTAAVALPIVSRQPGRMRACQVPLAAHAPAWVRANSRKRITTGAISFRQCAVAVQWVRRAFKGPGPTCSYQVNQTLICWPNLQMRSAPPALTWPASAHPSTSLPR